MVARRATGEGNSAAVAARERSAVVSAAGNAAAVMG